eukprot:TRINITY_DN16307_c0_g1_i1.p1 TRINITY_DN16307_c0_g1~~TRINITY_DN16307_c0_g1_i1.p1  ORF type:complete len:569 (+),score=126.30 TRINITY_DN16307_c0_g1_i1:150-1856(+)
MCIRDSTRRLHEHMDGPASIEKPRRPIRATIIDKKQWVHDKHVSACENCATSFSLFTRKHHCRRCGNIFCNDCMSKVELGGKGAGKVLTCFPCQETTGWRESALHESEDIQEDGPSGISAIGGFFTGGKKHKDKHGAREVDFEALRLLPSRLVTKHPDLKDSLTNGFGKLKITVVEASGLIAADMNLIGKNTSDAYVEMVVGEHEKTKAKTTVVKNSCAPRWHSKHKFPIFSPWAEVRVMVFDEDTASGDDVLGMVSFPLASLCAQQSHDVWLYLSAAPGQADEPASEPTQIPAGATVGIGEHGAEDHRLGAVHLQLQLAFEPEGEYLAHFVREAAPPPPVVDMDIDLMYANICALQEQVWPVLEFIWTVLALLQWADFTRSRIALATWLICCYYPWVTPLVVHALLLRHLYQKYKLRHSACDEPATPRSRQENDENHKATLGWVGSVANSSKLMMPSETKTWLGGIQNSLGSNAAMLDGLYGLFDWRDHATTKSVSIGVCVSLVLHSTIISWGYTMMVVGLFLFTFFTRLYLDLMNFITGSASYYGGQSLEKLRLKAQVDAPKDKVV